MGYAILGNKHGSSKAVDDLYYSYTAGADILSDDLCEFNSNGLPIKTYKSLDDIYNSLLLGSATANATRTVNLTSDVFLTVTNFSNAVLFAIVYKIVNNHIVVLGKRLIFESEQNVGNLPLYQSSYIDLAKVSTSKALLVYANNQSDSYLYGIIINIDANYFITNTNRISINQNYIYNVAISELFNTNSFLISYRLSAGNSMGAICVQVSGDTITCGSATSFGTISTTALSLSLKVLSSGSVSYVLLIYGSADCYLSARILSITGTTIAGVNTVQLASLYIDNLTVSKLNNNIFVCSFCNISASSHIYAIVVKINGTAITAGAAYLIDAVASRAEKESCAIDETHILLCSYSNANATRVYYILTIDTTLSYISSTSVILITSLQLSSYFGNILNIGGGKYLAVHCMNSVYPNVGLFACVLTMNNYYLSSIPIVKNQSYSIIAAADVLNGIDGKFLLSGLFKTKRTILTPGAKYYCDAFGNLSKIKNSFYVGIALTTNLLTISKPFWKR